MLLGSPLRRILRPLVIAVAALGLAVGAGTGLAAPASAGVDVSFTATVTNAPIFDTSGEVDIAGTKSSSSELVDIESNADNADAPQCDGTGTGSTNWSCEIDYEDGSIDGVFNVLITEQNADLTVVHNELSFRVYSYYDEPGPAPTTPDVNYLFTPGAVTVNNSISDNEYDRAVATVIYSDDGARVLTSCPSDADGPQTSDEFGSSIVENVSCHADLPQSTGADGEYTPGVYFISNAQGETGEGDIEDDESDGVIFVPHNALLDDRTVPVAFTSDAADRTVTVSGSVGQTAWQGGGQNADQPGGGVEILDSNGAVVCATHTYTPIGTTGFDGFSCTTQALAYGTHTLSAVIVDDGMATDDEVDTAISNNAAGNNTEAGIYVEGAMSTASAVGTVDFPAPTTTTPGSGNTLVTPDWSFTVAGDLTDLHPGDTITISGEGLPAGTSLDTVLHSVPTDLGSVVAAADGSFTQTVTIPADAVLGAHQIIVTATGPGLVTTTKSQPVTVTAVPTTSGSGGTTTITKPKTGVHNAGSDANGNTTAIQPNILTKALTPIADVAVHPSKIVSAIEIGLVLLLLAVLPAHLLNATIAEQSDRFERRFRRFPKRPRWITSLIAWFSSAPVVAGLVVTLATAILFGFADPTFGFTLASLRLILACGIALFLVGYVANALTAVIARNQWHITVLVSTRPYGLILTVVGVLISRLLHFSPGFLIGLILGLTIQGKSASGFAWRTVATRTSIVLLMSIAAWIGYSTLTLGGNEGGTFGTALLVETFVAITTEGVVALLVELLPLRFLEGERLYEHSRALWAVLYFLTVVVFVLAVVPWEGNWDALGSSLWIWVVVLAVFAAICVAIYIYFRRFAKPLEEEAGSEEVALGETVRSDR
jgi:hypothetical protein